MAFNFLLIVLFWSVYGDAVEIPTEMGYTCAFPFEYEGVTYTNRCVPSDQPWCKLDDQGNWDYCILKGVKPEEPQINTTIANKKIKTFRGVPCRSHFFSLGRVYNNECAKSKTYDGALWCYTITGGDDWDYCLHPETLKNQPFLYSLLDKDPRPVPQCNLTKNIMTAAQKKLIVDGHNKIRSEAGAAAMLKVQWSEMLADRAQYFADKCLNGHGDSTDCWGGDIGQNKMYKEWGTINIGFTISHNWGKYEKDEYNVETNTCNPQKVCGHYKQLVVANNYQVGCGYAYCKDHSRRLLCDYGKAVYGSAPFKKGPSCSGCANLTYPYDYKCTDGFCEFCKTGESGCQKQDVCRDTEGPDYCQSAYVRQICSPQYTNQMFTNGQFYKMIRYCRKSCGLCDYPHVYRNGYKV